MYKINSRMTKKDVKELIRKMEHGEMDIVQCFVYLYMFAYSKTMKGENYIKLNEMDLKRKIERVFGPDLIDDQIAGVLKFERKNH